MPSENSSPNSALKTLGALALILASLGFARHSYSQAGPARLEALRQDEKKQEEAREKALAERGGPPPGAFAPFPPRTKEDRDAIQAELFAHLGDLTPEQEKTLKEIRAELDEHVKNSPLPPVQQIRRAMTEVLTPEQAAKTQAFFERRMMKRIQKARAVLPPGEFAKLEAKLELHRQALGGAGGTLAGKPWKGPGSR